MSKLLKILYIEKDKILANELLTYFNPPLGIDLDNVEGRNFLVYHVENFSGGLQSLAKHNYDPLREVKSFQTILLDLDEDSFNSKLNFIEFLEAVNQLNGFGSSSSTMAPRFDLHFGFLATVREETLKKYKDHLTWLGVRGFLIKPFSLEEMEKFLMEYYKLIQGSLNLNIDLQEDENTQRRVLRYCDISGKRRGVGLPLVRYIKNRDGKEIGILSSKID